MESLRPNPALTVSDWTAVDPVPSQLARLSAVQVHDLRSELRLLIPEGDVADPEVSIVIPALNEEVTIAEFVA
ncbi:MAG: hypothetical protein ABI833_11925 [Acidobacteriota bacterium]